MLRLCGAAGPWTHEPTARPLRRAQERGEQMTTHEHHQHRDHDPPHGLWPPTTGARSPGSPRSTRAPRSTARCSAPRSRASCSPRSRIDSGEVIADPFSRTSELARPARAARRPARRTSAPRRRRGAGRLLGRRVARRRSAARPRGEIVSLLRRPLSRRLSALERGHRQARVLELLPVELRRLALARSRRSPGRCCGSGRRTGGPARARRPGSPGRASSATWSKVLWSSLRTITCQLPPRPEPGPAPRGALDRLGRDRESPARWPRGRGPRRRPA